MKAGQNAAVRTLLSRTNIEQKKKLSRNQFSLHTTSHAPSFLLSPPLARYLLIFYAAICKLTISCQSPAMHRRAAAGGSRGRSGSWAATDVLAGACKAHARTRMTPCSREPLSLIKGTWENRVSLPNLPVPLPALLPAQSSRLRGSSAKQMS